MRSRLSILRTSLWSLSALLGSLSAPLRFTFACCLCLLACSLSPVPLVAYAQSDSEKAEDSAFLPAWKLLGNNEKQEFISGYIQGWKDAVKILDIVISYVRENPERAERALISIKEIYDMSRVRPDQLVHEIDLFYSDPANRNAPLSKAMTAAKAKAAQ